MKWLDEYEIRARLLPGFLAVVSIPIAVVALGMRESPILVTILAILSAIGGPLLLATLAREPGQRLQSTLFAKWGGSPAANLLHATDDPVHEARRSQVTKALNVQLPDEAAETKNPESARQVYLSVEGQLRAKTRDRGKFPLVFMENCNYGFQRNILGLRPVGIGLSLMSTVVMIVAVGLRAAGANESWPWFNVVVGFLAVVITTSFWVFYPREERVKRSAEAYAAQLIDASYLLP